MNASCRAPPYDRRNRSLPDRRVGERLGRGETLAQIQDSMPAIAEGVTTARSIHERTRPMGLEMPLTTVVYRILYEGLPPEQGVNELMTRRSGSERLRRS